MKTSFIELALGTAVIASLSAACAAGSEKEQIAAGSSGGSASTGSTTASSGNGGSGTGGGRPGGCGGGAIEVDASDDRHPSSRSTFARSMDGVSLGPVTMSGEPGATAAGA
jgi:hypothetical protein